MGRVFFVLHGCADSQRDFDRLEKSVDWNLMKFIKVKKKIMGIRRPCTNTCWRTRRWKAGWQKSSMEDLLNKLVMRNVSKRD